MTEGEMVGWHHRLNGHEFVHATPWSVARQAPLSMGFSRQKWLRFMSIQSVVLSSHLILCHPLLLLPSVFPSIKVCSSESALPIRWPRYWSFGFSISLSSEYSGLISFIRLCPESACQTGLPWSSPPA